MPLPSSSFSGQTPTTPTREYPHDPKSNIEQHQRVRHQRPHASHPPHCAKHPTTAIRTPRYSHACEDISYRSIHWQRHTHKTYQHKWQQAIAKYACAPEKRQRAYRLWLLMHAMRAHAHRHAGRGHRWMSSVEKGI